MTTKRSSKKSPSLPPEEQRVASEQLLVLLKSFDLNTDVIWNEDENLFEEEYSSGDTVVGFSVENASRDLFYSANGLKQTIERAVDMYDTTHNTRWAESLGVKEAVSLFESSEPEDSGTLDTIWVGNIEKGWMVSVDGYLGEYCDEDYDISASFEFVTGKTPSQIHSIIQSKMSQWSQRRVGSWAHEISLVLKSLPNEAAKDALLFEIEKHFIHTDVFQGVVSAMQKKHLTEVVEDAKEHQTEEPTSSASSPRPPKKKI